FVPQGAASARGLGFRAIGWRRRERPFAHQVPSPAIAVIARELSLPDSRRLGEIRVSVRVATSRRRLRAAAGAGTACLRVSTQELLLWRRIWPLTPRYFVEGCGPAQMPVAGSRAPEQSNSGPHRTDSRRSWSSP